MTVPPYQASDYYQIDDLLTPEEQAIRLRVRECMEKDVAPIMAEYCEKAEFPFQMIPKLGALRIAGGTIKLKLQELMQAVLLSSWFIPQQQCLLLHYVGRRLKSRNIYLLWLNLRLSPAGV